MRVLAIAAILLGASGISSSYAQDSEKPAPTAPQTVSPQNDQNAQPQKDRKAEQAPPTDNRQVGRDWRIRPDGGDRPGRMMGRDDRFDRNDRDIDDWTMDREREADRYNDRGRYHPEGRGWDRERRESRGYYEEDRSRRRVKICIEYENGDEYCRYRN